MQLSQPLPPAPVFKSPAPASTGASLADEIKAKKDLMPTVTKVTTLADTGLCGYIDEANRQSNGNVGTRFGFRDDEDPTEYFDEPEAFRQKALEVAEIIRNAKRVVVYTGAGISTGTGANLPDYRGTEGVWTLLDKGRKPTKSLGSIESALPTYGHMALASLLKAGFLHYVVSTNVDGLHLRSGIPDTKLSELHGNAYLEKCASCKKAYLRDFDVTKTLQGHFSTHITGRTCDNCGGDLLDSIIHFGEALSEKDLFNAEFESKVGDVALVLGTSLRVSPANTLPSLIYQRNLGKMIICNLQNTPFDRFAKIRVKGYTDDLLSIVCKQLGVKVDLQLPADKDLVAPDYVDDVDRIYSEKQEVWKKHYEEWRNKAQEQKKAALARVLTPHGTVILGRLSPNVAIKRERLVIKGKHGTSQTIVDCLPSDLLMFKDCTHCDFILTRMCTKIIIMNCCKTTFTLKATVLTSCLEVLHSEELRVVAHVPVYTISVDKTKCMEFDFTDQGTFKMIVTNSVTGMVVKALGQEHHATTFSEDDEEITQYFTGWVGNTIETDIVVRQGEGGSLITSRREAKEFEEKQAETCAAMEKYARGMFKFEGQPKK